MAAIMGRSENLKLLFERGVNDPTIINDAYLLAAGGGHLNIMKFLFDNGANQPSMIEQALTRAACSDHTAVVKFLRIDPRLMLCS